MKAAEVAVSVEEGLWVYKASEGQGPGGRGGTRKRSTGRKVKRSEAERVEAGGKRTLEACRGFVNEGWSQAA